MQLSQMVSFELERKRMQVLLLHPCEDLCSSSNSILARALGWRMYYSREKFVIEDDSSLFILMVA